MTFDPAKHFGESNKQASPVGQPLITTIHPAPELAPGSQVACAQTAPLVAAPIAQIAQSVTQRVQMKQRGRGMLGSVLHAIEGLLHTVIHQRNMKVHVVSAIMVGLVGSGIPLGLSEKVTLIFCVLLVFFAEILNTALEALVDLHTNEFHDLARVTKDAAAAGVLVLAIGTVVIFAAVLVSNWEAISSSAEQILRQAALGTPMAGIAGLLIARLRRALWLDITLGLAAFALLFKLATWTTSVVFTVLTGALLCLCVAAAVRYRALRKTS